MRCEFCGIEIGKDERLEICTPSRKRPLLTLRVCLWCKQTIKDFFSKHHFVNLLKQLEKERVKNEKR